MIESDHTAAIAFLERVTEPDTWMTVIAIHPLTQKIRGLGFRRENLGDVREFLDAHSDHNLYWSVNPLVEKVDKKPNKKQVARMQWVQLDRDELSDEALAEIRNYKFPPTVILCSGGGYQAFWKLREPVYVNGNLLELEAANKQVVKDLHGDPSAWNLDRIMRIPGTVNWPNEKKTLKGRKPALAELLEFGSCDYQLERFIDRSAILLAKVGKDRREHVPDDEIKNKHQSDPHARKQADPARAVERALAKAGKDHDSLIAKINEQHALVWINGKLLVLWKDRADWDGNFPKVSSIGDVRLYWRKEQRGKINPIDEWIDSEERSEYAGIIFQPGATDARYYNLFHGWDVAPEAGDCSLFLQHLRDVICARDESVFEYVLQWVANIVQLPHQKPGTALAMGSPPGGGKGAVVRYLSHIMGSYLAQLSGSEQLLGRFNDMLVGRLLIYGDEVVWPGDRRGTDKLKAYITEDRVMIDRKGIPMFEIDCYTRLITATNREHIVVAEIGDRRYVPLILSDKGIGKRAYWEALEAERQRQGPAALLHHLLYEVKITRDLRENPKTQTLTEQKLLGLDHIGQFWREMLMGSYHHLTKGYGDKLETIASFEFGYPVRTTVLHIFFLDFTSRNRISYPASLDALGRGLRRYLPELSKREARAAEQRELGIPARTMVYVLPPLAEAREAFAQAVGAGVQWPGPIPGEM